MPRNPRHTAPAEHVTHGQWPDVTLAPDAPLTAHYGVALARRLAAVMKDRSLSDRAVARLSGMSHNTIGRIARGEVLPDLGTVARLEVALQTSLWPSTLWHTFTPDASGGTPAQP
ncbi:helix-turn-helix domain-containing protein [Streptomyces sp. NPDC087298]|uniref:helix-turn-helix domain-containing protein n=1 Tax=Streptomyces sp. NPDC087298 TaxID=3365779 RepID=UPI0038272E8F